MKRTIFLTFLFYLIEFASISASTAVDRDFCIGGEAPTKVYFGNGVSNQLRDAADSLKGLHNKLRYPADIASLGAIQYCLSYNENENILIQALELYEQLIAQGYSDFWRMWGGVSAMPEIFRDWLLNLSVSMASQPYNEDQDFFNMLDNYKADLEAGKKMLLVAHSQGNLYANASWSYLYDPDKFRLNGNPLTETPRFSLLSVAPPTTKVGDTYLTPSEREKYLSYTTLNADVVISFLRIALPEILPANTVNSKLNPSDTLNHGFVTSYFYGEESKERILSEAIRILHNMKNEEPKVRLVITWDPAFSFPICNVDNSEASIIFYLIDDYRDFSFNFACASPSVFDFEQPVSGAYSYQVTCVDEAGFAGYDENHPCANITLTLTLYQNGSLIRSHTATYDEYWRATEIYYSSQ